MQSAFCRGEFKDEGTQGQGDLMMLTHLKILWTWTDDDTTTLLVHKGTHT